MGRRTLAGVYVALTFAGVAAIRAMPPQFPGLPGAGQTAAPTGTGIIVGRAIDAVTGRGVAGAQIAISAAPAGLGAIQAGDTIPMDQLMSLDLGSVLSGIRQVLTDAQGRFAFTGLPKGTYSLAGTKSGWTGGNYGQRLPDDVPVPFALADGEQATDLKLLLWKNAAISGTVLDEAGEPIVGLGVRALRRSWMAGHARYSVAGSAQTDDRGMYRITGLRTGDYLVVVPQTPATAPAGNTAAPAMDLAAIQAMMSPGSDPNAMLANIEAMMANRGTGGIRVGNWILQTSSIVPPVVGSDGRMLAYRSTFFPTATTSAQGTPVSVTAGENDRSGIDFQLRPVPVQRVSGVITGLTGPPSSLQVRLLPGIGDEAAPDTTFDGATSTTMPDGSFMFLAVPPGQYTIRVVRTPPPAAPGAAALAALGGSAPAVIQSASGSTALSTGPMNIGAMFGAMPNISTEPTLWASAAVAVGESDVTDLSVALRPAFRISGRTEFDGAGTKPTAEQLRRLPISIERADVGSSSPVPTPVLGAGQGGQFDANGQFTTASLLPGRYYIRVPFSFNGWTLKSAMLNGKDAADVPLEIENSDVTGVVLTFTDQRSELTGTVRDAQGAVLAQASVVVFPTAAERWVDFGSAPRTLRVARVDKDGKYRVTGLPAGAYFVAASPADVGTNWQNPQFLDTLSRAATRVTLSASEKRALDLRTNR